MADGRWYPSLIMLQDGRMLAVSGLDETSQLNVVPEIDADGAGRAPMPRSPLNWPQYGHLFLLETAGQDRGLCRSGSSI
jgi:hypothetical protein